MNILKDFLNNPLLSIAIVFLVFILILLIAKNENIVITEIPTKNQMKFILYNVQIVNFRTYNKINFIAKAQKLQNPFYSNYLYCNIVELYLNQENRKIYSFMPFFEVYTNLIYGKSKNVKSVIYLQNNKKENSKSLIYCQELKIENKKVFLNRNYIYYQTDNLNISIYYPTIEIYLQR